MASTRRMATYTWRCWDKPALEVLIKKTYPQYWQVLPRDVERADFARHIVLDHEGGTYADSTVGCLRPIADVYHPSDTRVAVWEAGLHSPESMHKRAWLPPNCTRHVQYAEGSRLPFGE